MSKVFQKAPYSKFLSTLEATGMTAPALSSALGYADNVHNKWKETNTIPAVAALACDAIMAQAGVKPSCGSLFVLRTASQAQSTTVEALAKAMGIPYLTLDSL